MVAYNDRGAFIPVMKIYFNISKSINIINHKNKIREKNYMVISINKEV
jgi:hypothetical protein